MSKKNLVKVYIEVPTTEEGMAELDTLGWLHESGTKIREQVHKEIRDYLVEKYAKTFDFPFNKQELRKKVKERLIDKMAENALNKDNS